MMMMMMDVCVHILLRTRRLLLLLLLLLLLPLLIQPVVELPQEVVREVAAVLGVAGALVMLAVTGETLRHSILLHLHVIDHLVSTALLLLLLLLLPLLLPAHGPVRAPGLATIIQIQPGSFSPVWAQGCKN